jgi:hypothetical protein
MRQLGLRLRANSAVDADQAESHARTGAIAIQGRAFRGGGGGGIVGNIKLHEAGIRQTIIDDASVKPAHLGVGCNPYNVQFVRNAGSGRNSRSSASKTRTVWLVRSALLSGNHNTKSVEPAGDDDCT